MKGNYGTRHKISAGFTLIELLVVITIIGILIGILLPVLSTAKEMSRRVQCTSNLRSLALSMSAYAQDNNGSMPNGNSSQRWLDYPDTNTMLVYFANTYVNAPTVFYCPSPQNPIPPTAIDNGAFDTTNSARISYDFYAAYWPPEVGPTTTNASAANAPLAWDQDGGSPVATVAQNHGHTGGNVVFGDNHAAWEPTEDWEDVSWPKNSTEFYPAVGP